MEQTNKEIRDRIKPIKDIIKKIQQKNQMITMLNNGIEKQWV